ncbi:MAG TPA: hypothetical protein VNV85_16175 [Puia sp.]|jgi:hypothetical protein|nr:hypothetical protein [Puia sp.]
MKKSLRMYNTGVRKQNCKTGLILTVFLLFVFYSGFCQREELSNIKSAFEKYSSKFLHEKVFVHTDKSFYTAGEIVWFKLYTVEASFHKPSDLSKIAYIEILNSDLKPVLQAKISLKEGIGNGSLFIPLWLNSGAYKIRAYTNWMKNFSPDYYFEKDLTIVNTLKKLGPARENEDLKYDVQFFPEGGNLVDGIESKVAFRVTDQNGKGIDCKGSITDQDNNTVVDFGSQKFGIGQFLFTPVITKKYKAIVRLGDNNAVVAEIPQVYDHGYTLQLADLDSVHIKAVIRTNGHPDNEAVYLLVHTRQMIRVAEILILKNGSAAFVVNKNDLGDGISQFTIFNNNKQPLCERLYFKRPSSRLLINANTDQDEYGLRKKINVNIFSQDEKLIPAKANMSVSVFLEDSLQSADEVDISSYLLLSSDLVGNVESPSYYFKTTGTQNDQAIENLMLTHGWRRFKWEEVFNSQAPSFEFAPEYEGHIITGKITDKKSGSPVEDITAYLTAPGEHYQLGAALSDRQGKIQFDIKKFFNTSEVIVQAVENQKDSIYRIDIFTPFSEKFAESKFPVFNPSENLQDLLLSRSVSTQVLNTYQSDNLQKFVAPETQDSTAFYGQPDKKYFLDDYTRFSTMEEVMREYVTGILVKKQRGKFHINMLDETWRVFFNNDPMVLLDGLPVFDLDRIFALDPLKVKKVELISHQYFLGPIGANGIISYSSYKGDLAGLQLDPNAVILEYEGLQLQREFYSPVYDTPKQAQTRMPDYRTLLYWSPDVSTNQNGRKQINFYSSDKQGKYILFIEGITPDGKTGSQLVKFDVTK